MDSLRSDADLVQDGKFGEKGNIIEIDESCFFKRKNNKGRIQKQVWGLGVVERDTGRFFVQIVPNRSAATLIPIISHWISLKIYQCL